MSTSAQNNNQKNFPISQTSPKTSDEKSANAVSKKKIKAVASAHFNNEGTNNLHFDGNERRDLLGYVTTDTGKMCSVFNEFVKGSRLCKTIYFNNCIYEKQGFSNRLYNYLLLYRFVDEVINAIVCL